MAAEDATESSEGSHHLAAYPMENYLYALSKEMYPFPPFIFLKQDWLSTKHPLFPDRASDSKANVALCFRTEL